MTVQVNFKTTYASVDSLDSERLELSKTSQTNLLTAF